MAAGALAFILGKVLVDTLLGGAVIAAGREVVTLAGIVLVRRLQQHAGRRDQPLLSGVDVGVPRV